MRISRINIDRFGPWRQLDLPLEPVGLTVLLGGNGSGKTTLGRFLSEVLFGFGEGRLAPTPPGRSRGATPDPRRGFLELVRDGSRVEVHRAAHERGPGLVRLVGIEPSAIDEEALSGWCGGVDAALFEGVFLVDDVKLRTTDSLDHDRLATLLYGLTLGPRGQSLLSLRSRLEHCDPDQAETGPLPERLAELRDRHEAVTAGLAEMLGTRDEDAGLAIEEAELAERLAGHQGQLDELRRSLHGHQLLARAWPAWTRTRQLESELAGLPLTAGFPDDGISRLASLHEELAKVRGCREGLLEEARQLAIEAGGLERSAGETRDLAAAERLLEQKDRLVELDSEHRTVLARLAPLQLTISRRLEELPGDWTRERLSRIKSAPAAGLALSVAARRWHESDDSQRRVAEKIEQLAAGIGREAERIQRAAVELEASGLDAAIDACRGSLVSLQQQATLDLRISECHKRRESLVGELSRWQDGRSLPSAARRTLAGLGAVGAGFAVAGFATGVMLNGLVGTAVALLGGLCLGIGVCLDLHFQRQNSARTEELCRLIDENDARLLEAEDAGRWLAGTVPHAATATVIHDTTVRLGRLEELASDRDRLERRRERLAGLRGRHDDLRRGSQEARRQWRTQLAELGLPGRDDVEAALAVWTDATAARSLLDSLTRVEDERDRLDSERAGWTARIEAALDTLPSDGIDVLPTATPRQRLETAVRHAAGLSAEHLRLREQRRDRRSEAAGGRERLAALQAEMAALMVQAGATSTEEFQQRAVAAARREVIEGELAELREELSEAAGGRRDLVIDPTLLLHFDRDENDRTIAAQTKDAGRLVDEIERAGGRLEEIRGLRLRLETDRRTRRLLRQREAIRQEYRAEAESLLSERFLGELVREIQSEYEQHEQPDTLVIASTYLDRLTGGRFSRTWCPLGTRSLVVDTPDGTSWLPEQLGSGTRTLLGLAVRLALIEQLEADGLAMPLVLDDALATCDSPYCEAAVELLAEFAGTRRQVLYLTGYKWLADCFARHGGRVVPLPAATDLGPHRRAG